MSKASAVKRFSLLRKRIVNLNVSMHTNMSIYDKYIHSVPRLQMNIEDTGDKKKTPWSESASELYRPTLDTIYL
jgi:hypothetical protein